MTTSLGRRKLEVLPHILETSSITTMATGLPKGTKRPSQRRTALISRPFHASPFSHDQLHIESM